jgi:hypothetical protein
MKNWWWDVQVWVIDHEHFAHRFLRWKDWRYKVFGRPYNVDSKIGIAKKNSNGKI